MSAPSGPIQLIPRGLLGLLQLKNLGRLPDTLMGSVQPVVDMQSYWIQSTADIENTLLPTSSLATTGAAVLPFSTNSVTVPDDEVWWVEQYTVAAVCPVGAGEIIQGVAPILFQNLVASNVWRGLTDTRIDVVGAAAGTSGGQITARSFWAPPGSTFGFFVGRANSATTIAMSGFINRTRLPI